LRREISKEVLRRTRQPIAALLVRLLAMPTDAQALAGPVEIRIRLTESNDTKHLDSRTSASDE
jgi:hypothetical protein